MRRRDLLLLPVLLLALAGCAPEPKVEPRPKLPEPMVAGQRAPEFSFTTVDGQQVSSESLKGKPYVLTFWSSWCEFCEMQAPDIEKLYQRCRSKGVPMYMIGINGYADLLPKKAKRLNLTAPQALSPETAYAFGSLRIPRTVFVNRKGEVQSVAEGAGPGIDLLAGLEGIL